MNSELKSRIKTAAIGALAILLLIIFGGRIGIFLMAAVLSIAMVREFSFWIYGLADESEKRMVLLGTTWLVAFVNIWIPRAEYELLILGFFGMFGYFLFTAKRHDGEKLERHYRELAFSLFGLIYLAFLPLYLILIRDSSGGIRWTILFLLIVWLSDTGAYFGGKKFGKTKLYPFISPKKTREGALSGLGAALLVTILYKLIIFRELSWVGVFVIPTLVGTASIVGDLCESFVKRAFDAKDSGSILPGHGGMMDRFDGVVFSLPLMYACVRIFAL